MVDIVMTVLQYVLLSEITMIAAGAVALHGWIHGFRWIHYFTISILMIASVYMFLLAVSGGVTPVIPRRILAMPIRTLAWIAVPVGFFVLVEWVRTHIIFVWSGEEMKDGTR